MALLNIFAPKSPHMFTRLFHIPAIRDITLEHLQLLSNQLLAPPLPGKIAPFDTKCSLISLPVHMHTCTCIHYPFLSPLGRSDENDWALGEQLYERLVEKQYINID